MAQKLGLLATLLTDRPLLVLDEPMSGLEPEARLGSSASWRPSARAAAPSS